MSILTAFLVVQIICTFSQWENKVTSDTTEQI